MVEHLEGRVCVMAALEARRRRIETILVDHQAHPARVEELLALAATRDVPVRRVARAELEKLVHGKSHGGVAAICGPLPLTTPAQLLERMPQEPLLLMLEGVDDPRNLGYVLRTADALGFDAVLLKKHLWDFDAADVSRASSGAFERLPLVKFEGVEFVGRLQREGVRVWGCHGRAKRALEEVDLTGPVMLAIGGEKRGLSGATRGVCDGVARIPTRPGAATLALTQAAAIVMGEAARQRRGGSHAS